MKSPPLSNIEIQVPIKESELPVDLNQPVEDACKFRTENSADESVSTELFLDLLAKDRTYGNSDDSKLLESSSSSCRWNPEDSDYSLNLLLSPRGYNGDSGELTAEEHPTNDSATTSTASTSATSTATHSVTANDLFFSTSDHSLFGSDYSLNRMRARIPPSSTNSKNSRLLDASSHHSTATVDTFESDVSSRSKLPENIEVASTLKPKPSRNASVSFYPRVRIQRVTPRNQIPMEQAEAVWYSREEFQVIRQECFKTIRLMKDDEDSRDEDFPLFDNHGNELCRRGLEYKTPKAYKRRQKQKKDIRMVVFDELDFQEEQGMDDPLWLAKLSRDQSRSCVEAAIETAREDERQSRLYLGC